MLITSFKDLVFEAEGIQEFVDEDYSGIEESPELIKERGNKLSSFIARTGKMMADAKYHLNELRKDEVLESIEKILLEGKLSAGVQNALIDSICKEEQFLLDQVTQLNKTCKYQLEWCRSKLSMAKEEMNFNRTWTHGK
ncbi:hypothetical protein D0T84_07900 [Dysgonomonas sp. 521]|jgi:hypothetical protein|uniref:hypothetical protein n=1 Tax=Dysgonomonas sp. 521 TaxID=2302932 RepID=UPI0013CFCC2C|nr:hypothetical protein [Dysgonomonas sp. 521]NDV94840.1 hypothetical protein [Dysgonomonas sp. 521]